MLTGFHIPIKTVLDVISTLDGITYNLGPHIPGTRASAHIWLPHERKALQKRGSLYFLFSFLKDFCEI